MLYHTLIILYSHWSPTGGLPVAYRLNTEVGIGIGLRTCPPDRARRVELYNNKFELYIVQQKNASFLLGYELLHFCHPTFKRSQALFHPFLQIRWPLLSALMLFQV